MSGPARTVLLAVLAIAGAGCAIDREGSATRLFEPTCTTGTPTPWPLNRAWVDGTGRLPAREAYDMRVGVADSVCAASLECHVEHAGEGVISLTTWTCGASAERGSCRRLETTCALPPLEPGHYVVTIDSRRAFDVDVAEKPMRPVPSPTCWTPAPSEEGHCENEWRTFDEEIVACHPAAADAGKPIALRVTNACATCFDRPADCEVQVAADEVRVGARVRECECTECDACLDECFPVELRCETPPLAEGTYRLVVNGVTMVEPLTVLAVGEAAEVCSEHSTLLLDPGEAGGK